MTPTEATTIFLEDCRARHLADKTIKHEKLLLEHFTFWCSMNHIRDLRNVTEQNLLDFMQWIQKLKRSNGKELSRKYRNRHIRLVRRLFKLLAKRNLIISDIGRNLPPVTDPLTMPRGIMNKDQIMNLLRQPYMTTPLGFRDRVMMELLYSTALRGGELCSITLYNLNLPDRTLRVLGKGSKERIVPVGKVAAGYLGEYLKTVRPLLLEKNVSSLIFLTSTGHKLCTHDLGRIIKYYRDKAGLADNITTHSFRHTCATEMLKGGASIRHVQELLGHADIQTTQIYTHIIQSDLKKAHARTAPSERRKAIDTPSFDAKAPSWNDNRNAKYWPTVHTGKKANKKNQEKKVKRPSKQSKKNV